MIIGNCGDKGVVPRQEKFDAIVVQQDLEASCMKFEPMAAKTQASIMLESSMK